MKAYRGEGDLEPALIAAAEAPLSIIEICRLHTEDTMLLAEVGNKNLITDVAIAASLFSSALESSEINVLINTRSMIENREKTEARLPDIDGLKASLSQVVLDIRNSLS